MDWISDTAAIKGTIQKYKWGVIVLCVGIVLMLLPEGRDTPEISQPVSEETVRRQENLQEELAELLSYLDGAGKVQVLLTESTGRQTVYQTDQTRNTSQDAEDMRSETVILTQADRSEGGLVKRVDPPQYLGAIVLCQGADNASVKLAIVDAVSTVTGLRSDKISVWKMK